MHGFLFIELLIIEIFKLDLNNKFFSNILISILKFTTRLYMINKINHIYFIWTNIIKKHFNNDNWLSDIQHNQIYDMILRKT